LRAEPEDNLIFDINTISDFKDSGIVSLDLRADILLVGTNRSEIF